MKKLIGLIFGLGLLSFSPAQAANTLVVATCGNQTFKAGATTAPVTIDLTGKLCTSASGGGGGGGTSSTFGAAFPTDGTAAGFEDSSTGDMVPGTVDNSTGGLNVNIVGGGGAGGTSSNFSAAFPSAGTAAGFSDGTDMRSGRVYDTDSGGGTEYTLGAQIRVAASGGSVAIPGDASNGLDVDVTRVSGTVTISGAVTQGTSPWIVAGGGTAGSAASGVLTVQGIASMTPVQVSQATAANLNATVVGTGTFAVQAAQNGTWTVQPGNTANTTPWLASLNEGGNTAQITTDSGGALQVAIVAGGGSGGTSSAFGATFPTDGTAVGMSDGTDMVPFTTTDGTSLDVAIVGTVPISGTITADQGTSPWIVAGGGTAGSAATGVVTVQGIASMTPLLAAGNLADNAANSGWTNPIPAGANATTAGSNLPTYSNNDVGQLQVGTRGALNVQLMVPNDQNQIALMPTNADDITPSSGNYRFQVGAFNYLFDGSGFDRWPGNATDGALVNLGSNNDVTVTGTVTANAGTGTFNVAGTGSAGSPNAGVVTIQGITSGTPVIVGDGSGAMNVIVDSGTLTAVTSITNAVAVTQGASSVSSGAYASGAFASGAFASGSIASGAIASGAIASGAIADGAFAVGTASPAVNEDTASASLDRGFRMLVIQRATPADTAADLDYSYPQMSAGRLWVSAAIDSVTATNISMNLAQIAGTTTAVNNGGVSNGTIRVTVANDSTGILAAVTNVATIGTSVTPGTSAAHLGKAEDAVAGSGDTGVAVWSVRNDTLAAPAANGDYQQISTDNSGRVLAVEAPTAAMVRGNATITASTSDTSVIAASGSASLRTYVKSCQLANTGGSTTLVTFKDGNGGSTLGTTIAPTGGGSNIEFVIPLVTTANTAFYATGATSTSSLYVSCQGYSAP